MSRGVEIAEALRTAFAASYAASPRRVSQDIAVSRTWYQVTKKAVSQGPVFDHAAPVTGAVQVYLMSMPEVTSLDAESREIFWIDYPIQVGIAAYLKTTTPADIDPLAQVSQELRDYCVKQDPTYSLGIGEGVLKLPEIICDPDFDSIQTDKLFLSVFVLTFTGARPK